MSYGKCKSLSAIFSLPTRQAIKTPLAVAFHHLIHPSTPPRLLLVKVACSCGNTVHNYTYNIFQCFIELEEKWGVPNLADSEPRCSIKHE